MSTLLSCGVDGETRPRRESLMRRASALFLLLPLLVWVGVQPATAGVHCHEIHGKGTGHVAPAQDGDPAGRTRTVAQIHGGGLLHGSTAAVFDTTAETSTGITFEGPLTFTTNRATLTVDLEGTLDVTTGEFEASGDVSGATGKLRGAEGTLTLAGVQDLSDPAGSFTETVTGEICVDLCGNGRR